MPFANNSLVLLTMDVGGGRVGDQCTVVSSNNGWIKVKIIGLDYEINVRSSQIEEVGPFIQVPMYERWKD